MGPFHNQDFHLAEIHFIIPQSGIIAPHALEPDGIYTIFKPSQGLPQFVKVLLAGGPQISSQCFAPLGLVHSQPRCISAQSGICIPLFDLPGVQLLPHIRVQQCPTCQAVHASLTENPQPLGIVQRRITAGIVIPTEYITADTDLLKIIAQQCRRTCFTGTRPTAHGNHCTAIGVASTDFCQLRQQQRENYIRLGAVCFTDMHCIAGHITLRHICCLLGQRWGVPVLLRSLQQAAHLFALFCHGRFFLLCLRQKFCAGGGSFWPHGVKAAHSVFVGNGHTCTVKRKMHRHFKTGFHPARCHGERIFLLPPTG